jgi:hypothetical protein
MSYLARGPGAAGDRQPSDCLQAPTPLFGKTYPASEAAA